jgi:hypothetical protein
MVDTYIDNLTKTVKNHSNRIERLEKVEKARSVMTKTDTGDPVGVEGLFCINTFDNTFKVYADGDWRSLATW